MTAVVVLVHLVPVTSAIFVGSLVEGLLALLMVGFWTATVSIVNNTDNDLGTIQSDTNQVSNGNLYYFSWAGFVLSVILLVSNLRSVYGLDLVDAMKKKGQPTAIRLTHWAAFLAASMVVMGSSCRVFTQDCGDGDTASQAATFPESYCTRTKFAVAVGVIGVCLSLAVIASKLSFLSASASSSSSFRLETCVSSFLTVLNVFGVGYITSNSGPGRAIGNLYYFSWISFLLAVVISAECWNASQNSTTAGAAAAAESEAAEQQQQPRDQHINPIPSEDQI